MIPSYESLDVITRNRCKCLKCGDIIESRFHHDFRWCKCRAIFTDGGTSYIRRGGDLEFMEDMTESRHMNKGELLKELRRMKASVRESPSMYDFYEERINNARFLLCEIRAQRVV